MEPDQFDSDFNDTEDEGGNSEDEEKAVTKTAQTEVRNRIIYFRQIGDACDYSIDLQLLKTTPHKVSTAHFRRQEKQQRWWQ